MKMPLDRKLEIWNASFLNCDSWLRFLIEIFEISKCPRMAIHRNIKIGKQLAVYRLAKSNKRLRNVNSISSFVWTRVANSFFSNWLQMFEHLILISYSHLRRVQLVKSFNLWSTKLLSTNRILLSLVLEETIGSFY